MKVITKINHNEQTAHKIPLEYIHFPRIQFDSNMGITSNFYFMCILDMKQ